MANPDRYTAKGYSLILYLLDNNSGKDGTMTFTGQLDGKVTAESSNLRNTFTGPTTQTLVLGTTRYTATIGPYPPPSPPGAVNVGSISARVTMKVEDVVTAPEPGGIALASLGLMLLGAARARKRLRREAP